MMKKVNVFLAGLLFTGVICSAFASDYVPWDELTEDSWILGFGVDPLIYPVNSADSAIKDSYVVSFSPTSESRNFRSRGMNSIKFQRYGQTEGHMVSSDSEGVFSVIYTGDNYNETLLLTVAIDADSLAADFSMQIGINGTDPNVLSASDFAYYNSPYGRMSGYYSLTNPSHEPLTYAFGEGMVTVYGLPVDGLLVPYVGKVDIKYSFENLPGAAVFSVYPVIKPADGEVSYPAIHHTNRAFLDANGGKQNTISTFAVTIPGDLDLDLDVDPNDFSIMSRNWLKGK